MNFKPADFFLGIVDFLGMMVPGAVLVFLEAGWIQCVFKVSVLQPPWLVFAAAAYFFGHLLLASTELLNKPAQAVASRIWFLRPAHEEAVRLETLCKPFLGKAASENSGANFHAALSLLRLKHAEAAAEIDRHMAGYKLLRNLVAVFLIDMLFVFIRLGMSCATLVRLPTWGDSWPRAFADLILMLLFSMAFVRMLQWAYLLAFQYCVLISEQDSSTTTIA